MKVIVFLSLVLTGFGAGASLALPTVSKVNLSSYLGSWYEVFRLPNSFQDNTLLGGYGPCFNTTAKYSLLENGKIRVVNTCYRSNGSKVMVEAAKANAKVVANSGNAKLKVNFTGIPLLEHLGIGDGDYWIIDLGPKNSKGQYSYALVGAPSYKFFWLLSRNAVVSQSIVNEAINKGRALGFDTSRIKFSH
ncbi:hypothetical protein GW916_07875 [bacterium]|nr:hypothetical protein [bacterium]